MLGERVGDLTLASYNEIDSVADRLWFATAPELEPALASVFRCSWGQNPLISHFDGRPSAHAVTWDDVVDRESFYRTDLWQRYYRPLGVHHQMAIALPAPPGLVIGLGCGRRDRPFDQRDRDALESLRLPLAMAHDRVRLRTANAALRSVMRSDGWTMCTVSRAGRVLEATSDELVRRQDVLPDDVLEAIEALFDRAAPVDEVVGVTATPSDPVVDYRAERVDGVSCVVFVRRRHDPAAIDHLTLTPRQRETAALLMEGRSNGEIAARLGVRVTTVKKHLAEVFRVLGVGSRSEAIAKLRRS